MSPLLPTLDGGEVPPGVHPVWEVDCLSHEADPDNDPGAWLHLGPKFHVGDGLVELERFDQVGVVGEPKIRIDFQDVSLTFAEVEMLIGHLRALMGAARCPDTDVARDLVVLARTQSLLMLLMRGILGDSALSDEEKMARLGHPEFTGAAAVSAVRHLREARDGFAVGEVLRGGAQS